MDLVLRAYVAQLINKIGRFEKASHSRAWQQSAISFLGHNAINQSWPQHVFMLFTINLLSTNSAGEPFFWVAIKCGVTSQCSLPSIPKFSRSLVRKVIRDHAK